MHLPPRISNIIVWQFSQWLLDNDCLDVCMESTGKYRIPVFNILEDEINVVIANPKWVKAVKGNKDDTKDSKWIGDLFRLGLVYLGGNEKSTHQYLKCLVKVPLTKGQQEKQEVYMAVLQEIMMCLEGN